MVKFSESGVEGKESQALGPIALSARSSEKPRKNRETLLRGSDPNWHFLTKFRHITEIRLNFQGLPMVNLKSALANLVQTKK
jgi:hypothetical protein